MTPFFSTTAIPSQVALPSRCKNSNGGTLTPEAASDSEAKSHAENQGHIRGFVTQTQR